MAFSLQERTAIQGLHDTVFSSSTGELAALDLAPDFQHTLWAACMVNSRCFSDNVGWQHTTNGISYFSRYMCPCWAAGCINATVQH
jgi:predicted nicotinamide N-methyase